MRNRPTTMRSVCERMIDRPSEKGMASIEAEFGPDGPISYRVGLVDDAGEFQGDPLSLSADVVHRVVFANISFTTMGETTGMLLPCPSSGLAEDLLDQMFGDNRLAGRPIDEVITEALDLSMNETSDQMVADLTQLRDRLQSSIARVEAELTHHRAMQSKEGKADHGAEVAVGRCKNDMH